jgi:hypothetical protein
MKEGLLDYIDKCYFAIAICSLWRWRMAYSEQRRVYLSLLLFFVVTGETRLPRLY